MSLCYSLCITKTQVIASEIQLMFAYFQWSCSSVYNQHYKHEDRRSDKHAPGANCRSGENQCGQIR